MKGVRASRLHLYLDALSSRSCWLGVLFEAHAAPRAQHTCGPGYDARAPSTQFYVRYPVSRVRGVICGLALGPPPQLALLEDGLLEDGLLTFGRALWGFALFLDYAVVFLSSVSLLQTPFLHRHRSPDTDPPCYLHSSILARFPGGTILFPLQPSFREKSKLAPMRRRADDLQVSCPPSLSLCDRPSAATSQRRDQAYVFTLDPFTPRALVVISQLFCHSPARVPTGGIRTALTVPGCQACISVIYRYHILGPRS